MPDLAAQIRATLDDWAHPTVIIEHPEPLTETEYADLIARFQAAHDGSQWHELKVLPPSPFDRMRTAILAAVEVHDAATVLVIAETLGIEAA